MDNSPIQLVASPPRPRRAALGALGAVGAEGTWRGRQPLVSWKVAMDGKHQEGIFDRKNSSANNKHQ